MVGAQNAVMGDDNFGTNLPQTEVEDVQEPSLEQAAAFAKSPEYKRLREIMQSRMDYWRSYAPGANDPVMYRDLGNEERGWRTLVADVLISEFNSVFNAYEQAVEETKAKKK